MLKLNLRSSRQRWRIYDTPLYNLHFPRRPALLLQRCILAAAMPPGAQPDEEGQAQEAWTAPRILYYSRADGQAKRVVKGEKRIIEQLQARFGQSSVQVFVGGTTPDPRRAARAFGNAQAVVGPHGAGLANLVYAEPGTPVFLLPTYDGVYSTKDDEPRTAEALPPGGGGGGGVAARPAKPGARKLAGQGHGESGEASNGASEGGGTSAVDAYFTYLAAALGLRLHVLPYAKAHFWGNYSVPPATAQLMAEHVDRVLHQYAIWPQGDGERGREREREREREGDGTREGGAHRAWQGGRVAVSISQDRGDTWQGRRQLERDNRRRQRRPFDRPPPPAPPPHPPRERPPRGPLPPLPPPLPPRLPPPPLRRPYPRPSPPSPSPSPSPPPSLSPSLPVFGKGLAGAFDSVEQPFGRGFRVTLPEARNPGPPPATAAEAVAQAASSSSSSSSPWWAPATPPAMPPAPDKPSFEAMPAAQRQPPPSPRPTAKPQPHTQPPPPPTLPLPRRPMPPPLLELPSQLPPSPPLGKGGAQKDTRRVYPRRVLHDDGRWDAETEGAQQGGGEGEGATDSLRYRKWCGAWAQLHECEDNPSFMRSHCGLSCRSTTRLEHSMRQLLGGEGHELGLSAEAISAIHTLDAERLRDGHDAAPPPAAHPVLPRAVRVAADGGVVSVSGDINGDIHIDELDSSQVLHIQGGKKTLKAAPKRDKEKERKERARAKKEKKEDKGGKGVDTEDKGVEEEKPLEPLTPDEQAYARELIEELRPLFKRMLPARQVSLLNKLSADWRLLSPSPSSE